MTDEKPKPWEMQLWESPRAFRVFREFYLGQDPPRSVSAAYRKYRLTRGFIEVRDKPAPGRWQLMSRGRTNKGEVILGSMTWDERARAWDKHLSEIANAETEAFWREKIIGDIEVLGRLSEQGRVNIGDFILERDVPLYDGEGNPITDKSGHILTQKTWDINLEMIKKNGHLVKSITSTRYGPKIEMHDAQSALVQMGRHHKLFTDAFDVMSGGKPLQITEDLSDEQLRRSIQQLSEIGLALASGSGLPPPTGNTAGDDPARQNDEPPDA